MHKIFSFCLIAATIVACNQNPETSNANSGEVKADTTQTPAPTNPGTNTLQEPYKVALGDLNKDGKSDTILVSAPVTLPGDEMGCVDSSCTTFFSFVNNTFPAFNHVQALGGVIGNAGDLDDDGVCEIYFVPDWFTSSWTGLNIYSLKNNEWKKIASASVRREDWADENDKLYLPYQKRIIKHNKQYFEITENVMDEEGEEKLVPKKFTFNQ